MNSRSLIDYQFLSQVGIICPIQLNLFKKILNLIPIDEIDINVIAIKIQR